MGITTGNDQGLWLGTAGDLRLLVRTGASVPGLPSGATLLSLDAASIDSLGRVAFYADCGQGHLATTDSVKKSG